MKTKFIFKDRDGVYTLGMSSNKIYEIDINETLLECYYLKNDFGYYVHYHKSFFISLAEWRQQQINSILEDD
jgi:hypothetical protein